MTGSCTAYYNSPLYVALNELQLTTLFTVVFLIDLNVAVALPIKVMREEVPAISPQ